jgi:hypothetical protein
MAGAKKTEKKRGRGRPTMYSDDLNSKVDEYIALCQDTISETGRIKVKLPTIEGFAIYLGVVSSTVFKWAEEYSQFSESLKKIKDIQRERLLYNGLSGDYNSTIAKLVLSANHGMSEKQEVAHSGGVNLSLSIGSVKDKNPDEYL